MSYHRRLSPQDASFLYAETRRMHMHVASLVICDDPGLTPDELNEHIDRRLHRVPAFRQKLMWVPLGQGRPVWVDDDHFDVRFHVRHTGLPRPAGEAELLTLMGRLMSVPLDRDRPLWEIWMVDLPRKRKAVIMKTHHALIDGAAGADLATVMFDMESDVPPDEVEPWEPRPAPRGRDLMRESFVSGIQLPSGSIGRAVRAAAKAPDDFLKKAREVVEAIGGVAHEALEPAPHTSLSTPIGPHRRFKAFTISLGDAKAIKNGLGGTVNDAVLAMVAGGLRHLLRKRGDDVTGLTMRAAVPVSVRDAGSAKADLGNQVAVMFADLPIGEPRTKRRYQLIHEQTERAKESHQAQGMQALLQLGELASPAMLALASHGIFQFQWVMNLIVTNVPGPPFPLWFCGGRIRAFYPLAPLLGTTPVSIAALSYDGKLCFGLNGDWDAVPDLDELAVGIERATDELLVAAGVRRKRKRPRAA